MVNWLDLRDFLVIIVMRTIRVTHLITNFINHQVNFSWGIVLR